MVRTVKPRSAGGAASGIFGAVAMSAVAGVLLTAAVTPIVAISGAAASSAISIFENLPNHLDPGQLAEPSTIYATDEDGDEIELATFYEQDRETVAWNEISQYVKDAAVAEEDPRFYTHGGVDVLATSRAVLQNAMGQNLSGASTITMQYVRNVLIQEAMAIPDEEESEAAYEDAMRQDTDRKLKEMKLAVSIEKKFSKDEILLGYLNIALFGNRLYGIESAAQYYYGKSAKKLSLPESASLVAIVNNPSVLQVDDEENLEANQVRRDRILDSMLETGKITEAEHEEAKETPVEPDITPRVAGCAVAEERGLGHFCNYVQLYIKNDPNFGNTAEERTFNFMRGGYDIYTTIDLDIQEAGNDAVSQVAPPQMPGIDLGTAAVSTEVGTGRVLAMVQNRPFSEDPEELENDDDYTSVNYNTDEDYGGSKGFQTGSTSKAFTLAEWIRSGNSVRDRVDGNARTVQSSSFAASCLEGGVYGYDSWSFVNDASNSPGTMTVLQGTANSINGVFVSMQQQMDLCDTIDLAESLGVHRASPQTIEGFGNYGTTDLTRNPTNIFAGTDEVAPLTMATAYTAFADDGQVCTAVPIDKITGPEGEDVPFTESDCTDAISPEVAAGVAYALQNVVSNGTGRHATSAIGVPHFAKTGTTDDWVDMWTVGGSTEVVTSTWTGNVTGKVNTRNVGVEWAGRTIWPAMMNVADEKYGGEAFTEPSASALQQTMQDLPDVSGETLEDAMETLEGLGFNVTEGGEDDSSEAEGRVARTDPGSGSVPAGSSITIYTSRGNMSEVPDVVGENARSALSALRDASFSSITNRCNGNGDTVTGVSPSVGSDAKHNSQIIVTCDD